MQTDEKIKSCSKCGNDFPLTGFYRHTTSTDGRSNKCKECTKKDVRENYAKKKDYYRRYEKSRSAAPHRVAARKQYQQTDKGKIAAARAKRKYIERNQNKWKATNAVNNAVRDGKLIKAPCEICGNPEAQGHHEDYSKPLDVIWLCAEHHSAVHHNKLCMVAT